MPTEIVLHRQIDAIDVYLVKLTSRNLISQQALNVLPT